MIIADTGFWLALANRSDQHHAAALRALEGLHEKLITTWPVMTETCHLLLARLGVRAELTSCVGSAMGPARCFQSPMHLFHASKN
jgi:hypothetical protein